MTSSLLLITVRTIGKAKIPIGKVEGKAISRRLANCAKFPIISHST